MSNGHDPQNRIVLEQSISQLKLVIACAEQIDEESSHLDKRLHCVEADNISLRSTVKSQADTISNLVAERDNLKERLQVTQSLLNRTIDEKRSLLMTIQLMRQGNIEAVNEVVVSDTKTVVVESEQK